MEDDAKMEWHDKLDDGKLGGFMVLYILLREKGERLGW